MTNRVSPIVWLPAGPQLNDIRSISAEDFEFQNPTDETVRSIRTSQCNRSRCRKRNKALKWSPRRNYCSKLVLANKFLCVCQVQQSHRLYQFPLDRRIQWTDDRGCDLYSILRICVGFYRLRVAVGTRNVRNFRTEMNWNFSTTLPRARDTQRKRSHVKFSLPVLFLWCAANCLVSLQWERSAF